MNTYRTTEGENLSAICYQFYGKIDSVILRDVLDVNQNLADIPTVFPVNTVVHLPDIVDDTEVPVQTLWD